MNISDIDRMLSLTDEKYLDAVLDDNVRIRPRIRSYTTLGAAAAVIAVTVCGAVSLGNTGNNTVGDVSPIVLETTAEENGNVTLPQPAETVTENSVPPMAEAAADVTEDYSEFFSDYYLFRDEYTRRVLPFDTSGFAQTSTRVYRDNEGEPLLTEISLYTDPDDPANADKPYARISISETGYCGAYDLDPLENVPQYINETAVYTLFRADENNCRYSVYFNKDGYYYSCDFEYLDRVGSDAITNSIIENGLTLNDFETEKADGAYLTVNKYMTLYDANRVHEFAGLVPQLTELVPVSTVREKYYLGAAGAQYCEMTENGEPYYKELRLDYFSEFADAENSHAITLEYHWDRYETGEGVYSKVIKLSDVKFDMLDSLGRETDEEGYYLYQFTMTFGDDRYISVDALCRKEQLQTALSSMYAKYTPEMTSEMYRGDSPDLPANTLGQGLPRLTFDDIRRLSEKGDALDWSDFEAYECFGDVGSGMYALLYYLDDENYYVTLSGVRGIKPDSITVTRRTPYGIIDVRTGDIDELID